MSDRVVLDAAALDAINERLELAAWPGFTRISVGERDALVAAARENAALRKALGDLLAVLRRWAPKHVPAGQAQEWCNACMRCWPCPVERTRLLLTDRTDGDDGAGIMHGVDW